MPAIADVFGLPPAARQVNVYDADGRWQTQGLLRLNAVRGLQVDDEGNLCVLRLAEPAERAWDNQLTLSKFPPTGGDPLWSRRWEGYVGQAQVLFYGNQDCQGPGSPSPHPELPFGLISALSVWQDRLFVVDVLNRRIVKCRIVYEEPSNPGPDGSR